MTDAFVRQLDGCSFCPGGNNCSCACEAMLLHRATQGRVTTTACHVRSLTGDKSGGTNLEQMKAVSDHYGVNVGALWRPGQFTALKSLLQKNIYPAIVQIGYAPLAGTALDCFHGAFRAGHAIYVKGANSTGIRYGDPGADGRYAGCPNGWQSMSWSLLERATDALPLGNGMTLGQDFGPGHVYAYLGPADPIPAISDWHVTVKVPDSEPAVQLYSKPFGPKILPRPGDSGRVRDSAYRCKRTKVSATWWFQIEDAGVNRGRFFTPNRWTEAVSA